MPHWHRPVVSSMALLALGACTQPAPPVTQPRPVVVESPLPLSGSVDAEILPGSIHARVEADLSFRIAGKIAERRVDMGAHVVPGTVLAVLDPEDARLNLAAARATVAAAEADVTLAQAEEQRYRELRTRNFVGQSQLDLRINTTRLAVARREQAQAEYNLAANQSRYTHLTADAAGVVTQILAEPGNVVTAGQPVVRFAADGEREVHVSVPEGHLAALRADARLEVELLSNPGQRYRAKVRDLDPQADRATRTHRARITLLDPDEHVELGATAAVVISAVVGRQGFRLPASALGNVGPDRPAVWRVLHAAGGDTVEPVPVEVLRYFDGAVMVSGSLAPDDRLVTAGVHRLVAGMAVQVIERTGKAAL